MNQENSQARVRGWVLPTSTPIRTLFEWCNQMERIDRLLLSVRLDQESEEPILLQPEVETTVTSLFGDKILERKLARKWPGTELIGHRGMVYEVAFDSSLIEPMAEHGPYLEDWRMNRRPALPEDPCLFSCNADWPILFSVTHEREAWILTEDRPPFCTGSPIDLRPEHVLIPPASQGFIAE